VEVRVEAHPTETSLNRFTKLNTENFSKLLKKVKKKLKGTVKAKVESKNQLIKGTLNQGKSEQSKSQKSKAKPKTKPTESSLRKHTETSDLLSSSSHNKKKAIKHR
jgi:hypothetical protein